MGIEGRTKIDKSGFIIYIICIIYVIRYIEAALTTKNNNKKICSLALNHCTIITNLIVHGS